MIADFFFLKMFSAHRAAPWWLISEAMGDGALVTEDVHTGGDNHAIHQLGIAALDLALQINRHFDCGADAETVVQSELQITAISLTKRLLI